MTRKISLIVLRIWKFKIRQDDKKNWLKIKNYYVCCYFYYVSGTVTAQTILTNFPTDPETMSDLKIMFKNFTKTYKNCLKTLKL